MARTAPARSRLGKPGMLLMISATSAFCQAPAAPANRPARVAPPARIVSFKAEPESVAAGDAVTLTWASENPNSVSITPDPGRVAARGTRVVHPASTTTYTLTVAGPNNVSLTQSVTVRV